MKTINLIQLVSEIIVGLGFLGGLIPFMYLFTAFYVIPLTIVNLVLSIVAENKTTPYTITNVIMAWFALIPILGIPARVVGVIMSVLSAVKLAK